MKQSTKQRLAQALKDAGAPDAMVAAALAGRFDYHESESATPITDLVDTAYHYGLKDIAERAIRGEFDATRQEARMWGQRN